MEYTNGKIENIGRLGSDFAYSLHAQLESGTISEDLLKSNLLNLIASLSALSATNVQETNLENGKENGKDGIKLNIQEQNNNTSKFNVDAPPFDNQIWEKIEKLVLDNNSSLKPQLVMVKDYLDGENKYSNENYVDAFKVVDDALYDKGKNENIPLLFSLRQKSLDKFFEQRKQYEDEATNAGESYDGDYVKKHYKRMFADPNFTLSLNIVLVQLERGIKVQASRRVAGLNKKNPEILKNIGLKRDDFFSAGIGNIRAGGEGLTREGFQDSGEISGAYRAALFSPPEYNYAQFSYFALNAAALAMRNPITRDEAKYHDTQVAFPGDGARGFIEAKVSRQINKEAAINRLSPINDTPESELIVEDTVKILKMLATQNKHPLHKKILSMMLENFDEISHQEENRFLSSSEIGKVVKEAVINKMISGTDRSLPENVNEEVLKRRFSRQYNEAVDSLRTYASRVEDFDVWVTNNTARVV